MSRSAAWAPRPARQPQRPACSPAALAGCGFHLRGTADLPFATLYSGFSAGSALGEEFRRELVRTTSTRLVSKPDEAQVVLQVLGEIARARHRRLFGRRPPARVRTAPAAAVSRHRRRRREFIPPSEIILRRDISAADNQLTARVDEEALLYRDMQKDMVQQLLRRLATIRLGGPE